MRGSRIRIAAAVFCALAALTVYSVVTVRRQCSELLVQAGRIIQTDGRSEEIRALQQHWQEMAKSMQWFVPNQTLTDLNERIMQLDVLEKEDARAAELAAITADLTWLRRHQLTVF